MNAKSALNGLSGVLLCVIFSAGAHAQSSAPAPAPAPVTGRFEYFDDNQGYSTGTAQAVKEFTGTYEYKWLSGLLGRVKYRHDWSNQNFFHKGNTELVEAPSTLTVAVIAFFGPKR